MAGQHGIVHTHAAAAAVFNHQIRISLKNLIKPFQIRSVMFQKTVSAAVSLIIRSDKGIAVIVNLKVADSVLFDQTVHYAPSICPNLRIAKIQLIPISVHCHLTVALKEPATLHLRSHFTLCSHELDFQPDAGNHSFTVDIICNLFQSIGKSHFRWIPLSNPRPPRFICVPSGINTVILTANSRCCINNRQFLLGSRISPEAVHIVIENNGQLFIILIFPAD